MKLTKRILVISIAGALALSCAACGSESKSDTVENIDDIVEYIIGVPKDTVFLNIDGYDVTAEEYLYWSSQALDSMYQYGSSTYDVDLNDGEYSWIDDYWKDGIEPTVLQCIENYCTAMIHAQDYDLEVSQEEIDEKVAETMETSKAYYSSEEEFVAALAQMCMTETGYEKLAEESIWYSLLYTHLYSEGCELYPSDEQVQDFADEYGYYNCKYVYLSTTGEYTEEGVAEVKERAEQALSIITSYTTPEEIDESMTSFVTNSAWNEDQDEDEDGLVSSGGWLDDTFDEGVRSMEIGEVSIIEDEDYGYFVVERLAIDPDVLRTTCATALLNEQLSTWNDSAQIEYTDAYNAFNPRQFYIDLTEYRLKTDVDETE